MGLEGSAEVVESDKTGGPRGALAAAGTVEVLGSGEEAAAGEGAPWSESVSGTGGEGPMSGQEETKLGFVAGPAGARGTCPDGAWRQAAF